MPEGRGNGAADEADEASRYVAAVDSALSAEMLAHLQVYMIQNVNNAHSMIIST